jgi:hypothetical protein
LADVIKLADVGAILPTKGLLAFDVLRSNVFWQTWGRFFGGHGSLLAFDVLQSKGLLADVEPVFRAWYSSGL